MRIAAIMYILVSVTINFMLGSTLSLLLALPSFPLVVWLLTTGKKKMRKPFNDEP
jgi:hypothetical protein